MVFDLKWSGQNRTISAALKYRGPAVPGSNPAVAIGPTQLSETSAGILRINTLAQDIIDNVTIATLYTLSGAVATTTTLPTLQTLDEGLVAEVGSDTVITLLTNASSSANDLDEKFRKFKQVIYNVSIDGIGQVIEYQRRGAKWSKVEPNALELMNHAYISTVINYVLTGVNVLSAMDFVNWAYDAGFGPHNPEDQQGSFINVSPVFRVDHLGVAALPPELRELALDRLKQGRQRFESSTEIFDTYYTQLVDRFISVIETTLHNPAYLPKFLKHIQLEDSVSKTKLTEVVPEWTPYFQS
jgi:hypothetical protein